jgi:hypothetical protein
VWLLSEIRQAPEPLNPRGEPTSAQQARDTLETAARLLQTLGRADTTAFAQTLLRHLDELVAPLRWPEQRLRPWRDLLDRPTEAFIAWAWQHRQALQVDIRRDFPEPLQPIVTAVWEALSLFHRSSSLAESLHSWLRPYLQVHRSMPNWLLALLQLFWNHHPFQRNQRKGKSPLALAAGDAVRVPSLSEMVDRILQRLASQPAAA